MLPPGSQALCVLWLRKPSPAIADLTHGAFILEMEEPRLERRLDAFFLSTLTEEACLQSSPGMLWEGSLWPPCSWLFLSCPSNADEGGLHLLTRTHETFQNAFHFKD